MKFLKKIEFSYFTRNPDFHPESNPDEYFSFLKNYFLKLVTKYKDSLHTIKSPFFTLPKGDVLEFSNLKLYSTELTGLSHDANFELFESCIEKFKKYGFPKTICVIGLNKQCEISANLSKNFTEHLILAKFRPIVTDNFSLFKPTPSFLPVKCFSIHGLDVLSKNRYWINPPWEYGSHVQHLKISFFLSNHARKDSQNRPKWETFEILIQNENLPNLKGICVNMFNSTMILTNTIFPLYEAYLKNRKIQILNAFDFYDKVQELSQDLSFTLNLYSR
jgi:hypothetical protein